MAYHVLNWDRNFENNKSRERDRCSFVCVPNKQDGLGLTRVLAEPDGAAIYGVWNLILGALSRQRRPRDGWLTQDGHCTGTPWAPDDLALRWRRPVSEINRALEVLSSQQVGWMEDSKCPPGARQVPADCPSGALEGKGKEGKGKEGKGKEGKGKEGKGKEGKGKEGKGKEGNPPAPRGETLGKIAEVQKLWNEIAEKHNLPQWKYQSKKRAAAVRERLKDESWLADFKKALGLFPQRPFLLGKNDRKWKANIKFMLRPETVHRILEGEFQGGSSGRQETTIERLERIEREAKQNG